MNHSIILIITMFFTNLIVFLACTFSPYLSPRGIFFGVRLDDQYRKDPEIKKITKAYLHQCTAFFIVFSVISIWMLYTATSEKWGTFIMLISIFLLLALCFAFFVKAYHQIKAFADALHTSDKEVMKAVVDTDLIKAKNKLKRHFRYLYLLPLVLVIITISYSFINYANLPEMIPTHWNLLGHADAWQPKTPFNVGMQSLMQLIVVGTIFYTSDKIFTARGRLDHTNYESSKQTLLRYLKQMGYCFYVMTLSIQLTFIFTTLSMINGTSVNQAMIVCGLILPIAAAVYMFAAWFKYRKNTPSHAGYSPENADSHWIWGSFYYNPEDPSAFVEKRYGIGWTINMATPLGKGFMIATLLIILASIFLPLIMS